MKSRSKSARMSLINNFPPPMHKVPGFSGCGQDAIRTRLRRGDAQKDPPVIEFAKCVTNKHASAISIPSMRSFLNVISA